MGSKKKTAQQGAQVAPAAPAPSAPEENPLVNTPPVPEQPEENPLVKRIQNALLTYPTLKEGYLCNAGPFFDRGIAESKLGDGEKLIIVKRPKAE